MRNSFGKVLDLCDYLVKTWQPESLRWGWGEALFCYALTELDSYTGEDRYLPFVKKFCDKYAAETPVVDSSDTAAPGLVTYYMQKKSSDSRYKALTDLVLDYIRKVPKVVNDDAPNHFGFSKDAKDFPVSIWVDSLMMFSVFTARYGAETRDAAMVEYAARQPKTYADCLMDEADALWYHTYRVDEGRHYPYSKLFWGRGNGWVITSLPMILEHIGLQHPRAKEIVEIYTRTSEALLRYQRKDGCWETVFNKVGKTYRELSATALICGGWFAGIRLGILDKKFLQPATLGFNACIDSLIYEKGGVFFPEISRPTVPMAVIPYLWYKFLPRGRNWNYGVAALVFAAIEENKVSRIADTISKEESNG